MLTSAKQARRAEQATASTAAGTLCHSWHWGAGSTAYLNLMQTVQDELQCKAPDALPGTAEAHSRRVQGTAEAHSLFLTGDGRSALQAFVLP